MSKSKSETLNLYARPGETKAEALGHYALTPDLQAAFTLRLYGIPGSEDVDLGGLTKALQAQAKAASQGDFTRIEALLSAQAHTLDAVFNNLARIATQRETVPSMATYLKLALKAQSQCRTTLEALAEIKNPASVSFVKQANIAHGHQQVNNGPQGSDASDGNSTARARKKPKSAKQTKRVKHDEQSTLDTGAPGTPSRADPAMAPVGPVHGAENGQG